MQNINIELKDKMFEDAVASSESIFWAGIEDNINLNSKHKKVIVAAKVLKKINDPIGVIFINYDIDIFYK